MNTETEKRVICDSGQTGWQCHLQENYKNLEAWAEWSEMYGLCHRLGFDTPEQAWDTNPLIQGSVVPSDFRVAAIAKATT